jgi:hypothetical protein
MLACWLLATSFSAIYDNVNSYITLLLLLYLNIAAQQLVLLH